MQKYLLVYYGGSMETDPKKAQASMAAWMKWFKDMGKAVVDMGAPTVPAKIVSKDGAKAVTSNAVTGYSIVQAEDLDAAIALVKKSPQLAESGKIAIYAIQPM